MSAEEIAKDHYLQAGFYSNFFRGLSASFNYIASVCILHFACYYLFIGKYFNLVMEFKLETNDELFIPM